MAACPKLEREFGEAWFGTGVDDNASVPDYPVLISLQSPLRAAVYNMKYLGVEVENEDRKRNKKNKLKRKERSEPAYTSSRWTPYLKVGFGLKTPS